MASPIPESPSIERYLTVAEFAALQHMSKRVIWGWIRERDFPHVRIGRRVLVPPDAMARYMAATASSTNSSTSGRDLRATRRKRR